MDIFVVCRNKRDIEVAQRYGWKRLFSHQAIDVEHPSDMQFSLGLNLKCLGDSDLYTARVKSAGWLVTSRPSEGWEKKHRDSVIALAAGVSKAMIPTHESVANIRDSQLDNLGKRTGICLLHGADAKLIAEWGACAAERGFPLHLNMIRGSDCISASVAAGVSSVRIHGALWNTESRAWDIDQARRQLDAFPIAKAA